MELFQRIKKLAKSMMTSDSAMAAAIGMKQSTFSGYLNQKRQNNLWPLLPKILEVFPQISRQWLYFEEGPMFIGRGVGPNEPQSYRELMHVAEAIAADCGGSWGKVLQMVVGRAQEELEQQGNSPQTSQELAEAKDEALRLHRMMEGLQAEIISLQKELLAMHKAEKAEKTQAKECAGRAAHTGHTAARS